MSENAALAETVESIEAAQEPVNQPEVDETVESVAEGANSEDSTTSGEEGNESGENSGDAPAEGRKKKNGVQKRIDELTAKRIEVERERDYYKKLAEEQNVKQQVNVEPVQPNFDDFDGDVDKYAQAMSDYANDRADWINHQNSVQLSERQKQLEGQKRQWKYQDSCAEFAKSQPDFFAVTTNPDLNVTNEMTQVIVDSNNGPELAYYLGKNPDLAYQIAQMPTHIQYKEMGRIEYELTSKKPPVNTLTKAPAPIKPVGNKSSVGRDLADMDYDEFVRTREKQISARRR